jgi:hypothetical protein
MLKTRYFEALLEGTGGSMGLQHTKARTKLKEPE